jgi:hypothetical protein
MLAIWLGALLIVVGLVLSAAPPLSRARLSGRSAPSPRAGDTLEPRKPGAGFDPAKNWPGLALIALGVVLMLSAAIV